MSNGSEFMYSINKNIFPGHVVWAYRNVYYDQPEKIVFNKVNMFLVLKTKDDYFYGCKVERNSEGCKSNVLKKKFYNLKYDSRVAPDIYKINFFDIASSESFKVTEGTLANIKRNIYKRIILGHNKGPIEYQEVFVKDYLKDNKPKVDNIVVYPSVEKEFKYYYIYEDNDEYYSLIKLKKENTNTYSVEDNNEVIMSKDIPYFDYYVNHSLLRDTVDRSIFGIKEKKLENIISNK